MVYKTPLRCLLAAAYSFPCLPINIRIILCKKWTGQILNQAKAHFIFVLDWAKRLNYRPATSSKTQNINFDVENAATAQRILNTRLWIPKLKMPGIKYEERFCSKPLKTSSLPGSQGNRRLHENVTGAFRLFICPSQMASISELSE